MKTSLLSDFVIGGVFVIGGGESSQLYAVDVRFRANDTC